MRQIFSAILLSGSLVLISGSADGQGHYLGGSFNTNDYFVPPSPGWVLTLFYSFSGTNYRNAAGEKVDIIPVSVNPAVNISVGQNVVTHSVIPMALYFGKKKVLNANWGVLVLPMLNNPTANIALDYYVGQDPAGSEKVEFSSFGFGDMYVQPIWLTWNKEKLSTTFSYGIWMPTGRYEPNSTDNIGLGYWSHNLRVASRYKPPAPWAFTGALTFEINHQQQGAEFTEGPHLTLDYAASYNFPKGHELGMFGFGTWQGDTDKGQKAVVSADRILGIGVYGAYWFKPGKFGSLARFTTNYLTRNRYGGIAFQIGLTCLIM
jgi:hypothetical protein